MTARAPFVLLAALLVATIVGCGQTGPLTLPESARPIERVDQSAPPAQEQQPDDEGQDER